MGVRRRPLHAIVRPHHLGAVAAALTIVWTAAAPVGAQSVEVSPLRVELTLGKGSSHTQAVTLTNQGSEPVRIRARLRDWFMSLDGAPQFDAPVPDVEEQFLATSWVRLAPPEQVVQPGQQGIVRFTTTAPADVGDGGYRAAILFEFGSATDPVAQRRSVQFRSRIATLVYMNVGKPPLAVELTDLGAKRQTGQPPNIVATFRNSSRANIRTKGSVTLRDADGRVVRTLEVPNVPLLPMSERQVAIATAKTGQEPIAPGDYRVEVKVDVGMPALIVGETTLKVLPPGETRRGVPHR